MDEKLLESSLAKAGLRFLGTADITVPLIPPTLATFASACSAEDGAYGTSVELDDDSLSERANSEWFRLTQEGRFLDGVGSHFLLAVERADEDSPHWWWADIELLDHWDVIDAGGTSGIIGNGPGRPAFVMLSPTGRSIMRVDVGEHSIDFNVVPETWNSPTLRRRGEWMLKSPRVDDFTRAAIARWLTSTARQAGLEDTQ